MYRKIVFGSLLACFLMLMIPTVSAVEYQTVVDANESYLMQELQDKDLDLAALKDKLKNMNVRELREVIQNINTDELKETIMLEVENSDLTEQGKLYVEQLLDSEFFLTILIKGIIIPVILYTIAFGSTYVLPKFLALPLVLITGFAVPRLFLIPIFNMVMEETGSLLIGTIVYFVLGFFDIKLAGFIVSIIF